MKIGIPEALLFQRYEPAIRTFFDDLEVDTVYSGPSNREILERGIRDCVDEACLPIKVFQGHVSKLREECDKVMVPRLMKCEFGDSICPKFAGLPELVGKGSAKSNFIFTEPLYLNNKKRLMKVVAKQSKQIEIPAKKVLSAFKAGEAVMANRNKFTSYSGGAASSNKAGSGRLVSTVALLGHPYNLSDSFINMNLISKLHNLGVRTVTGEELSRSEIDGQMSNLMKVPYWLFYRENLGRASVLVKEKSIDGILYVSSFCCGTDSVTIEMIKRRIGDFPMLVIKLDEHTAEAGLDTRLEAYAELLERRRILKSSSYDYYSKQKIYARDGDVWTVNGNHFL